MSTVSERTLSPPADAVALRRQRLAQLTAVELHKFFTTPAGFAMPAIIVLFSGLTIFGNAKSANWQDQTNAAQLLHDGAGLAAVLLALIGTVILTSEFSSHRAFTTFTLTPNRSLILIAKLCSGVLLGFATVLVLAALASLAASAYAPAHAAPGGLSLTVLAQSWLLYALMVAYGIGLGALLIHPAAASAAVVLAPVLLDHVLSINGLGLSSLANWLDPTAVIGPFSEHVMSSTEWTHAATAFGFWILVPLTLGARRVQRRDL